MSDYRPTQEVRFSVVMFGGVSLCIYMNGISQELLHMVRATAPDGADRSKTLLGWDQLETTEKVYRKLGQILYHGRIAGEATAMPDPDSPIRTRLLIDLLSGTSAGGINAVYLAKALTNDKSLQVLHDLWLEKGNIDTLMNDDGSQRNVYPSLDPPTSLLNSQRMYGLLLEAFDAMDGNSPRAKDFVTGLVDELDLFVTATDLNGLATPLQLSDRVVEERVHKARFRFMYSPKRLGTPWPNDFTKEYNEMLAFAARCTSSFPIAFEPMKFRDVGIFRASTPNELDKKVSDTGQRHKYLKFFGAFEAFGDSDLSIIQRPLADGGYLNNKPFSFVIEEQTLRRTDHPVRRKLLFLDPFPDLPEDVQGRARDFTFIENAIAAASSLPRQQPIREDIERVNANNRRLRAAQMLAEELEHDIPNAVMRHISRLQQRQGEWQLLSLEDLIGESGESYAVYHRLRVSAVSDDLAQMVTRLVFNDDSDELYAIRLLLHAWRNSKYAANPTGDRKTETFFLYEFDLGYRFRRLSYTRRRIDDLLEAVRTTNPEEREKRIRWTARELGISDLVRVLDLAAEPASREQVIADLMRFREAAEEARDRLTRLREQLWLAHGGQTTDPMTEDIRNQLRRILISTELNPGDLRWILRPVESAQCQQRAEQMFREREKVRDGIQKAAALISDLMKGEFSGATRAFLGTLNPDKEKRQYGPEEPVAKLFWLVYQYFDCRDFLLFPVQRDNLGGEDCVVEMYRISPVDADGLRGDVHKLTGTALGAFGAFLDHGFRENDILWGRLDGADRIIGALLPDEEDDDLRQELRDEAFRTILREEFDKGGCDRFFELLMQAIDVPTRREDGSELTATEFLVAAQNRVRANCSDVVKALMVAIPNDDLLLEAFRRFYVKPPEPPLKVSVTRIRRAVKIFGGMLDQAGGSSRAFGAFSGPLVQVSNMVTALVDFALPGDLKYLFARHLIRLAVLAEVLLLLVGWWRNDSAIASTGALALGVTIVLDFLMLWIGAGLRRSAVWGVIRRMLPVLLVAGLLALLWFRGDDVIGWLGFVRKK